MSRDVAGAHLATTILLLEVSPSDQPALVDLARGTQPIFAKQPGFVSGTLLTSADGTRLIQVLQWRSAADGAACMRSADWASEAGARFMAFIGAGKAAMEVVPCAVVSTSASTE
ncbi:MAG TPA: hypothetical protein VGN32_15885 [Ktedonobacterales bacterium]|jgi:heme-degrading monooxygenase HmoA|nr:hypothetical protein [Ktedonobacterales bacterium]